MKLFYGVNSPYARKCRIVAIEKDLQSKIVFVEVNSLENPPELIAANPLGTVPALIVDEETSLCDSTVICEYLDSLSLHTPLFPEDMKTRVRVLNMAALADGVMDAAVTCVLQNRRPEDKRWPDWVARKEKAIMRTLGALSSMKEEREAFHIGTINLAVALAYVSFRLPHLPWATAYPELHQWAPAMHARTSFMETQPKG